MEPKSLKRNTLKPILSHWKPRRNGQTGTLLRGEKGIKFMAKSLELMGKEKGLIYCQSHLFCPPTICLPDCISLPSFWLDGAMCLVLAEELLVQVTCTISGSEYESFYLDMPELSCLPVWWLAALEKVVWGITMIGAPWSPTRDMQMKATESFGVVCYSSIA